MWDFSKIKVDALWINQRNGSFTVNIKTFCRVVVMNVEKRYRRGLVIRPRAADEKTVTGETCLDLSYQEICSFRVRLQGTLFAMVNDPFTTENCIE